MYASTGEDGSVILLEHGLGDTEKQLTALERLRVGRADIGHTVLNR